MPIMTAFGIGIAFVVLSIMFLSPLQTGSGSATEEVEHIDMTIAGLKSTYKPGEPIIFSVKAEGVSDSSEIACGSLAPSVVIHGDNNSGEEEGIINLTPLIVNIGVQCIEPMPFDKAWTFGDKPGEEIVLDQAGSYTVVASYEDLESYEDILVEKKFTVAG